ncbi:MAG: hypothetical protein ABR911_01620 [Syntrophales bacterium]|jgi:hypothetical protein
MIYPIKGGKRDGERIEADWKEGSKLFKKEPVTVHNVAADGKVMISKTIEAKLVFEAGRDEEIGEPEE